MIVTIPGAVTNQWRVAYLSMAAAGLSLSSVFVTATAGEISWTWSLTGVILLSAAFQVQSALALTRRESPERVRSWMPRLMSILYMSGTILLAVGLWALTRHRLLG